jgi:uncharacterized membrane protein
MIDYSVYKFFHVLAIIAFVAGLVALLLLPVAPDRGRRRVAHWITGVAAIVALVSGFGLHARLGGIWEGWVVTKVLVWLALLAILVWFRARPSASPGAAWWLALPAAAIAVFMAIYKPF